MEVKIEVSESQFKDILEKELTELPKETIQKVIVESIKEYFVQDNYKNLNAFLVDQNNGYGYATKTASKFLNEKLNDCNYSELQEVVDNMIKELKANYNTVLIERMTNILTRGITNDYAFQSAVEGIVTSQLIKMKNN